MAGHSKKLRPLIVLATTVLLHICGTQIKKIEAAVNDDYIEVETTVRGRPLIEGDGGSSSGFLTSEKGCDCISDCRKSGQPYDWCYVDKESPKCPKRTDWDMCTPDQKYNIESLATQGVVSSYGIPCRSECKQEGTDFTCETIKPWKSYSWDYCSPTPGYDYRGKKCSTKCNYYGKSYKWCYLAEGSWGYCSKAGDEAQIDSNQVVASYGNSCENECGREGGTSYYWCRTKTMYKGTDWDYCSPKPGHDYRGQKCAKACRHYGYHYKWCRIRGGSIADSWGYCSHEN